MLQHLNHLVKPVVIETILETHKGVLKACIVGVTIPVYYDLPVGIVQRVEGSTVTEDELHAFIEGYKEKKKMKNLTEEFSSFVQTNFPMNFTN